MPLQVAQRTPRINAFGYPVYELVGQLPLEAAQSINDVTGRSQSEIEDFFGLPVAIVRDGEIRILRYRSTRCSIAFFLYPDTAGRRAVAFANYEWNAPTTASARSCLLSLARVGHTQRREISSGADLRHAR